MRKEKKKKDRAVGHDIDLDKHENHRFIHPLEGIGKMMEDRKKVKSHK